LNAYAKGLTQAPADTAAEIIKEVTIDINAAISPANIKVPPNCPIEINGSTGEPVKLAFAEPLAMFCMYLSMGAWISVLMPFTIASIVLLPVEAAGIENPSAGGGAVV